MNPLNSPSLGAPKGEGAEAQSLKSSSAPHLPIEVGLAHLGKVLWRWRRWVRIRRPTDRSRYRLPHRRRVFINDALAGVVRHLAIHAVEIT